MGSSSSTDLPAGTELGGFRIERVIAHGSSSVVYEATQLDLDRRVALKLFARGASRVRSPEHPNIVAIYTAGTSPHGDFLAMQLVRDGRTLSDRLREGPVRPRDHRAILGEVTAALDAAHRVGLVHGALTPESVLLDGRGRALLSGLRPGDEADVERDRAALAALARRLPTRRARWPVPVGLAAAAALAVGIALARRGPDGPPAVPPGMVVLGSTLSSSSVRSLDCNGSAASGASPACSVAQTTLAGHPLVVRAGVIRRWTVRGAEGDLALAVLRRHGRAYLTVAHTPYVTIPDRGLHALRANLPLRAGDLVGLQVAPGAAVGVRRGGSGARTIRWFGPLVYDVRPPERGAGTGFDHELLLRVEYEPGATWRVAGALQGAAAENAPPGRVVRTLATRSAPTAQTVSVVRVGSKIVVDLFDGDRRAARVPLVDADPAGSLEAIEIARIRLGVPIVGVRWQNSDGVAAHDYVVGADSLTLLG